MSNLRTKRPSHKPGRQYLAEGQGVKCVSPMNELAVRGLNGKKGTVIEVRCTDPRFPFYIVRLTNGSVIGVHEGQIVAL